MKEILDFFKADGAHVLALVASIATVLSTLITLFWNGFRDWRISRGLRRSTALAAAVALEEYASNCTRMIHHAGWASRQAARELSYGAVRDSMLPTFKFPEPIEWDRLRHSVQSELLAFPATVDGIRDELGRFVGQGLPLEFFHEVQYRCAETGLKALALARRTRSKHGCTHAVLSPEIERELSEHVKLGADWRAQREQRLAREHAGAPLDYL